MCGVVTNPRHDCGSTGGRSAVNVPEWNCVTRPLLFKPAILPFVAMMLSLFIYIYVTICLFFSRPRVSSQKKKGGKDVPSLVVCHDVRHRQRGCGVGAGRALLWWGVCRGRARHCTTTTPILIPSSLLFSCFFFPRLLVSSGGRGRRISFSCAIRFLS